MSNIACSSQFCGWRMPSRMWRNIVMALMCLFYGFFVFALVGQQTGWWKISF